MFFPGSRYLRTETATLRTPDGREIRYTRPRLPGDPRLLGSHRVTRGERLDLLAHRYLRDPERYWRIADANRALWPESLLATPGREIRIPTPEG